ncbi:histone H1 protein [Burkholderia mallei]|nr:hypothetical protein BMAFMH_0450 [Burkholderia mallei FMH]EDK58781.1 hypothetical protein BMAJHU_0455 [Burkholderia mallei JHU]EEP88952.1 histone H1 protein [Burkholderia mallei GB8 horse 4]RPA14713.1 histone H1 protein [Burkholderia mallei]TOY82088.1 histone H1 protein [Burkholderia pseudomallei]
MRRRRLRAHGRAPGDARSRAARAGVKRSAAHAKRRGKAAKRQSGKAVTQHAMR